MKLLLLSIRDRQTASFLPPFCAVTTGQAIRQFSDLVNTADKENNLYQHPDDFDLWVLGEFDPDTGKASTPEPSQLALGKQVSTRS